MNLGILCSLILPACVLGPTDDGSDPRSTQATERSEVQVPAELTLAPSAAPTCLARTFRFNNGSCIVSMTCHDQRAPAFCRPSFCSIGCAGINIAQALCVANCSSETDCSQGNLTPQVCPGL